jgi:hypothetical protein
MRYSRNRESKKGESDMKKISLAIGSFVIFLCVHTSSVIADTGIGTSIGMDWRLMRTSKLCAVISPGEQILIVRQFSTGHVYAMFRYYIGDRILRNTKSGDYIKVFLKVYRRRGAEKIVPRPGFIFMRVKLGGKDRRYLSGNKVHIIEGVLRKYVSINLYIRGTFYKKYSLIGSNNAMNELYNCTKLNDTTINNNTTKEVETR